MSKLPKWVATRALAARGDGDLSKLDRAGMGPGADIGLAAELQRLLREGAFVDQQVAVLRQLDQPVARRGIAGKDHRLTVDGVEPQAETGRDFARNMLDIARRDP